MCWVALAPYKCFSSRRELLGDGTKRDCLEFICIGSERDTLEHKLKAPLCRQEMSETQASYVVEAEGRKKEQSSSQGA